MYCIGHIKSSVFPSLKKRSSLHLLYIQDEVYSLIQVQNKRLMQMMAIMQSNCFFSCNSTPVGKTVKHRSMVVANRANAIQLIEDYHDKLWETGNQARAEVAIAQTSALSPL